MGFNYITTIPGLIKVVEEIFNFIAFMCIVCHEWTSKEGDAFLAASIGGFVITAILLMVYVFDFQLKIALPWVQIQFFYCVIWAIFYLVATCFVLDFGRYYRSDSYIAGGVFGLFATITYLIDAFFKYKKQE